ncbi:MAG: dTDP-4-dehydrorhamnose 3,5-epimerase [Pseudomonadota bacterium]|nr:dTDP-4-dehydrorhamnose 3,5-epimerase [Pseudomonadota bacterium]
MIFHQTPLAGARLIELEKRGDERGFFARMFCEREFGAQGLETRFVNVNNSLSGAPGTLRGLHYQIGEAAEVKLVRCLRGALWDAILDLRPGSPSYGRWFGETLSADNRLMMYVPRGFAHAILTLEPDTEALYLVSAHYAPTQERGVRWNDPRFDIGWPIAPREISAKDAAWPDFDALGHGVEQLRVYL